MQRPTNASFRQLFDRFWRKGSENTVMIGFHIVYWLSKEVWVMLEQNDDDDDNDNDDDDDNNNDDTNCNYYYYYY